MPQGFLKENRHIFRNLDKIILGALGLLCLLYLASGIFTVQANQAAVLVRFGAFRAVIGPGIHYRLPWPVDKVTRVKTTEVKRQEVGFFVEAAGKQPAIFLPYSLTGDKNIIHCRFTLQYLVTDPGKYTFGSLKPEAILKSLSQHAILETMAASSVDSVLTTGKRDFERKAKEALNRRLKRLPLGISVVSLETKQVQTPAQVAGAFKEVVNAREQKSTSIHKANTYRNRALPSAKAKARGMLEEARAYKARKLAAAQGESTRFLGLFRQYQKARDVTRHRLLLELVESMLPRTRLFVLATDEEGRPVKLRLVKKGVWGAARP